MQGILPGFHRSLQRILPDFFQGVFGDSRVEQQHRVTSSAESAPAFQGQDIAQQSGTDAEKLQAFRDTSKILEDRLVQIRQFSPGVLWGVKASSAT